MLICQNEKINRLYYGSKKIKTAYWGSKKIFEAVPHRFKFEYLFFIDNYMVLLLDNKLLKAGEGFWEIYEENVTDFCIENWLSIDSSFAYTYFIKDGEVCKCAFSSPGYSTTVCREIGWESIVYADENYSPREIVGLFKGKAAIYIPSLYRFITSDFLAQQITVYNGSTYALAVDGTLWVNSSFGNAEFSVISQKVKTFSPIGKNTVVMTHEGRISAYYIGEKYLLTAAEPSRVKMIGDILLCDGFLYRMTEDETGIFSLEQSAKSGFSEIRSQHLAMCDDILYDICDIKNPVPVDNVPENIIAWYYNAVLTADKTVFLYKPLIYGEENAGWFKIFDSAAIQTEEE